MKRRGFTERLVNFYVTARRHIPEDFNIVTAVRTSNLFTLFICFSLCIFRTMFQIKVIGLNKMFVTQKYLFFLTIISL